eukprot:3649274-Alexandrium_andersonii.AAC.1
MCIRDSRWCSPELSAGLSSSPELFEGLQRISPKFSSGTSSPLLISAQRLLAAVPVAVTQDLERVEEL